MTRAALSSLMAGLRQHTASALYWVGRDNAQALYHVGVAQRLADIALPAAQEQKDARRLKLLRRAIPRLAAIAKDLREIPGTGGERGAA